MSLSPMENRNFGDCGFATGDFGAVSTSLTALPASGS